MRMKLSLETLRKQSGTELNDLKLLIDTFSFRSKNLHQTQALKSDER